MEYKNLIFEEKEGIGIIKISRPKALNALNSETLDELASVLKNCEKDRGVRVLIITGDGDKAFVAGADIVEMKDMDPKRAMDFSRKGHSVFSMIENMPKATIAAVNGYALGGGFELCLSCDIIYASEKARFGFPEITLGIHPGFGGTQRASRLVGLSKAKELILSGRMISSQEAYELGLINKVVPHEELMNEVLKLADSIKGFSLMAIRFAKECVNKSLYLGIEEALELEARNFGLCFGTKDQKEGMQAFLDKRKPVFRDE